MSRRSRRPRKGSANSEFERLKAKARLFSHALADRRLTHADSGVLGALLFTFDNNEGGRCDPGLKTIAMATGIDRKATVIEAIRALEARGYITVNRRHGRSNTNSFAFNFIHLKGSENGPFEEGEKVRKTAPAKGTFSDLKGTENRTQTFSEPSALNRAEEEERARVRAPDGAHEEAFTAFWEAYPWRVDELKCREEFDRILTAGRATAEELRAGALRYREETAGRDPDFIAYPLNWLKGERWRDERRPTGNGAYRKQRKGPVSMFESTIEGSCLEEEFSYD